MEAVIQPSQTFHPLVRFTYNHIIPTYSTYVGQFPNNYFIGLI